MLAPRASSAFVCIRCELKLARPRVPPIARRPSHASFSTTTHRRDAFDDLEQKAKAPTPRPRPNLSEHPLGKIRKRKGKADLREKTAKLTGVKALGKDAEILVLQEVGGVPKRSDPSEVPQLETSEGETASSILASLEAQAAKVGQEEINQQLESLRPKTHTTPGDPHYINQATFRRLTKSLSSGFTVNQLSRYFAVAKGVRRSLIKEEVLDDLRRTQGGGKRLITRTQWYPGTTPLSRRLPGVAAVPKGPKSRPLSKPVLVDQILRNAWNIVLLEEIEAPGEIELALKPWQFALLNAGGASTPLDRIGTMRKVKLATYGSDVLRITADKSTAEYAANDIEELLRDTEVQKFDIQPWVWAIQEDRLPKDNLSSIFSQDSLQTVGQLSGTIVEVVSNHQISIRGLEQTSVQEAQRLLITMLPLKRSHKHTVESQRIDQEIEKCYLLPNVFKDSLSYHSRSLDLGRWTLPIPVAARTESKNENEQVINEQAINEQEGTPDPFANVSDTESLQKNVLKALQVPLAQQSASSARPVRLESEATWLGQPQTQLSTDFGHALLPMSSSPSEESSLGPKTLLGMFSNALPGISTMLTGGITQRAPPPSPTSLEYEFVASPHQPNRLDDFSAYPALQLRFQINDELKLRAVRLRFNIHYHDVFLPDQAVDLRFRSHQVLTLQQSLKDPNIKAFSEAVSANFASGARLTAPPSLTLKIPTWTIKGDVGSRPGMKETRTVTYLFTGINYRHSYNSMAEGFPITYSMKQTGKLGTKGGALALHYIQAKDERGGPSRVNDPRRMKEFIRTSFVLADRITDAAGTTAPLAKILRPRHLISARKVRRQGTEQEDVALGSAEAGNAMTESQPGNASSEGSVDIAHHLNNEVQAGTQAVSQEITTAGLVDEEAMESPVKSSSLLGELDFQDPYLADVLHQHEQEPSEQQDQESLLTISEEAIEQDNRSTDDDKRTLMSSV